MSSEKPTTAQPAMEEKPQPSEPEQKFELIPQFKIPAKAKGMARAAGIDLSAVEEMAPKINTWADSVEQRLNVIIQAIPNLPMQTIELLKAEAQKQREEYQTKQPQPQQGGADLGALAGSIAPVLQALGVAGGSANPANEKAAKLMDALFDSAIDNVLHPKPTIAEKVGEEVLLRFAAKKAADAAATVG